jgi:hypothetical protein
MASNTQVDLGTDLADPQASPGTLISEQLQHSMIGRTFTLFPKLPPELRIKIWKLSMPKERFIQPRHYKFGYPMSPEKTMDLYAETPASLFTCQESRHEALSLYKPFQVVPGPKSPTVYLNPDTDILCLTYRYGGDGGGRVWRAFADQGIIFRRLVIWDITFLRCFFKRNGGTIDKFDELSIIVGWWRKDSLIVGFREFSAEELLETHKEVPDHYAWWKEYLRMI